MNTLKLPNVTASASGWMEIEWFPTRDHDTAAKFRRATRVFVNPVRKPADQAAFLDGFREGHGDDRGALDSVALLTQLMLVARDGSVMPSPITYEVQLRGSAARMRNADTPQYELSRQRLLSSPTTGGLVPFAATTSRPISGSARARRPSQPRAART